MTDSLTLPNIKKSTAQGPNAQGPYIIAFANQKGGVAKTTSTLSIGGALVQRGYDVLLIDLDPQANLTLGLGQDPKTLRAAISDVFFNAASLLSITRPGNIPGLDLAPCNANMDVAERFLPLRHSYEGLLRQAIQTTTHMPYEFILIDCPPVIGAVTLNAIVAADLLIIPTQPEYFSAHALRTMMLAIRQVRSRYNPNLAYRILITMFDRRNRIHRQVSEQIRQTFQDGVLQSMIQVDTKLRESVLQGLPITHYKNSRSVAQYQSVAEELINLAVEQTKLSNHAPACTQTPAMEGFLSAESEQAGEKDDGKNACEQVDATQGGNITQQSENVYAAPEERTGYASE
jgi:chromosome partitioning protein